MGVCGVGVGILATEILRANLRGTYYSPHLKPFSDSLVATRQNCKFPSLVLKTSGPQLATLSPASPVTRNGSKVLPNRQALPNPVFPSQHPPLMDSSSLFKHHLLQEGFHDFVRLTCPSGHTLESLFVETPFTSRLYHAAMIWPPVCLLLCLQSGSKSFKHLLCARNCSGCL